jgi:cytochrome c oxidase subunit 2
MSALEKFAIGISSALLMVFFGALLFVSANKGVEVPTCITDVEPFTTDTLFQVGPNEYELHMVARMWAFQPSEIRLPVGSKLNIYVTSQDIIHGFHVEEHNLNLMAVPNAINYFQATFNRVGTFDFACHEYCGAAHHTMAGRFIITETADAEPQPVAEPFTLLEGGIR